ncbi:MAG: hypothetical protein FJW23_05450 [Acidimicrobiia bacterium]|nr:hypothetical protein [Acidimicrobiia bacterium]
MNRTRVLLLLFSAIALATSVASLYVHYQLLADSSYTSFCDVSATVSCEAVYLSEYGAIGGVPVAVGGVIWAAAVMLLVYRGMREPMSAVAANVAEYVFVLSVIGLAAVLYLGYASYFVLQKVCLLCVATYVGVFGVFFVAAGATTMPFGTLPARLFRDLRGLPSSPAALVLALVWLVGSGALVVLFPGEEAGTTSGEAAAEVESTEDAGGGSTQAAAPAAGGITDQQRAEFGRWYSAQPYVPVAVEADGAQVVVVKFNDYQCPPCRQTFLSYKPVLDKFAESHPGAVKFVTRDFPLDPECNSGGGHTAGCEAAAAVRMARDAGRADAMEDWLFNNQPSMSPDLVRQGVQQVAGVADFDTRYPKVLELVRADVRYGQTIGVNRTPTFFINGRKIEGALEPQFFEMAIEFELARQGGTP